MLTVEALGAMVTVAGKAIDLSPGSPVVLVVRPESIEIVRERAAAGALRATVVSRTFLGEKTEYMLRCADTTLQALRYNAGPPDPSPIGETVTVRFSEGAVTVLPEGPPA